MPNDDFYLDHYSQENSEPKEIKLKENLKKEEKNAISSERIEKQKQILKQNSFLSETNKYYFGYFESIFYNIKSFFFSKKSRKQKIYEIAEENFRKEFDYVNIFRKIHEINKLKIICFNEDQLLLFNTLSKPLLIIEKEIDNQKQKNKFPEMRLSTILHKSEKSNFDLKRFEMAYQRVKQSEKDQEINKRLINLVDSNLNNFP